MCYYLFQKHLRMANEQKRIVYKEQKPFWCQKQHAIIFMTDSKVRVCFTLWEPLWHCIFILFSYLKIPCGDLVFLYADLGRMFDRDVCIHICNNKISSATKQWTLLGNIWYKSSLAKSPLGTFNSVGSFSLYYRYGHNIMNATWSSFCITF